MAITTYRVRFTKPWRGFNAGEIAWFTQPTAEALTQLGWAVQVDALPGPHAVFPPGLPVEHLARHSTLPAPANEADRLVIANEYPLLAGA